MTTKMEKEAGSPMVFEWILVALVALLGFLGIGLAIGFAHAWYTEGSTPWEILSDPEGAARRAVERKRRNELDKR